MTGELHHVVRTAALFRVLAQFTGEFAGVCVPGFSVAGTPRAIGALAGNFIPEITCDVAIPLLPRQLIAASGADGLRDMRVRMNAFELVAMLGERIEEHRFLEAARHAQVLPPARDSE